MPSPGPPGSPPPAEPAAAALRRAGLRVTAPRVAVLDALRSGSLPAHADAQAIGAAARRRLGRLSVQAVYDVLRALTDAGLVRRVVLPGSPARFELRTGDNHHHLVCRSCGATEDVDCLVAAAPCLRPVDTAGYAVDEAEVTFWGTCPNCDQEASA